MSFRSRFNNVAGNIMDETTKLGKKVIDSVRKEHAALVEYNRK